MSIDVTKCQMVIVFNLSHGNHMYFEETAECIPPIVASLQQPGPAATSGRQ